MMKSLYIILFFYVCVALVYANDQEMMAQSKKNQDECRAELGVAPGGNIPDNKDSCYVTCISVKSGEMNADYSVNMVKQNERGDRWIQMKNKELENFNTIMTACQNSGKGKEKCEASKALDKCVQDEMKKRDVRAWPF